MLVAAVLVVPELGVLVLVMAVLVADMVAVAVVAAVVADIVVAAVVAVVVVLLDQGLHPPPPHLFLLKLRMLEIGHKSPPHLSLLKLRMLEIGHKRPFSPVVGRWPFYIIKIVSTSNRLLYISSTITVGALHHDNSNYDINSLPQYSNKYKRRYWYVKPKVNIP